MIALLLTIFTSSPALGNKAAAAGLCRNAYVSAINLNCFNLPILAKNLSKYGDIPNDGNDCRKANKAYDALSAKFEKCNRVGSSEKNSCYSLCRGVYSSRATSCNNISRFAQKIRFDQIKTPSCNEQIVLTPERTRLEPVTLRPPPQNNKPGFAPIEEMESKPALQAPVAQ